MVTGRPRLEQNVEGKSRTYIHMEWLELVMFAKCMRSHKQHCEALNRVLW